MIDVIKIISSMQEDKEKQNKSPSHVLFVELQNAVQSELKKELNDLVKSGRVEVVNTINSKAVYVKEKRIATY